VSNAWVVNASPVIVLSKIGQLSLLDALGEVLLPDAVAAEILAGETADSARVAVAGKWARRCTPAQVPQGVLEWGLGAGESAVLAVCLEHDTATAVLDDAAARAAARVLGIDAIGTLGVLVRAKQAGFVPQIAPVIDDLRGAGLYLGDALVREVLVRNGEHRA